MCVWWVLIAIAMTFQPPGFKPRTEHEANEDEDEEEEEVGAERERERLQAWQFTVLIGSHVTIS